MENNYKERVIEFLVDNSTKSTSEIASLLSRDFYFTSRLLDEMEKDGKLIKTEIKTFTYWKLKED